MAAAGSAESTVLWDYLTQQYQQDVLTVLAATPVEYQQQLLNWLLRPVTPAAAAPRAAEESADTVAAAAAVNSLILGGNAVVAAVDPVEMIGVLDELLIAAIDAAPEDV
jgi:hypothetical protein